MIELTGISRAFEVGGEVVHALREIDLVAPPGDYLSIMGPSGSGKSTLLNILGCLDRPTTGRYRLDGEDVARLDDDALSRVRRYKIGFVFQSFQLIPRLTAAMNIELPMIFAGVESVERKARTELVLREVGLLDRAHHRPNQLSGGERQRVAIARAVVMRPVLLLADEPTGNLDTAAGAEIVRLIEGLNADGLTVVVVTHDNEIGQRANRLIRLRDGGQVAEERREGALMAPS